MQPYYDVLAPGGQVSLAYYFITAFNLPPRDFQVYSQNRISARDDMFH